MEDWRKNEKWETLLLENGFTDEGISFRDHMISLNCMHRPYRRRMRIGKRSYR